MFRYLGDSLDVDGICCLAVAARVSIVSKKLYEYSYTQIRKALASHWDMCPLNFQQFNFSVIFRAVQSLTATL